MQQGVELPQCGFQRLQEVARKRGQGHAGTLAHQQRILERLPQLSQGVADSGLAPVKAQRSPRDVAFCQQGVQGKQQIEVEAAEVIHAVDAIRAQNEFPFVTRMTDHAEHRFTEREDLCMHGSTSLVGLIAMAIAMLAGAAVPFQAASNAALGRALGHPLWATLSSLVVSLVVVAVLLVVARVPAPTFGMAAQGPAWLWLGGVAGVAYITAALMLTPKLGAASFIVCVIAGQMLASLAIDHLGLMRLPQRPAGAWRVAGIGLILLGMVVVQMSSTTGNPGTGSASS